MFGISALGWVHTLGSLPAIPLAAYMFIKHGRIVPRSRAGLAYFVSMLIGGLTMHHILVRRQMTRMLTYGLVGLAAGTLVMLAYFMVTGGWRNPTAMLGLGAGLFSGPVTGFLSATLFWLIRRPDRISLS